MLTKVVIAFFLTASSAVGIVFYVQPLWKEFHEIRRETDYLRSVSAELDTLIANRDLLLKKINAISREDLARVNAVTPKGQRAGELLTFLEALIAQHGLALTDINLAGTIGGESQAGETPRPQRGGTPRPQNAAGAEELTAGIELAGSYNALKAFLQDLESYARLTDVEALTFSPGDTLSEMTLKVKTYYQK